MWLFFIFISCIARFANAGTIWIDTDPSTGSPFREVDDAFALLLASQSPDVRIAGISTTYGNASLRDTTRSAKYLVDRFGAPAGLSPADVHAGASSARNLGRRTFATEALAAELRKEKRLTYVALGPLTNLATFLEIHPELTDRIERIISVGGTSRAGKVAVGPNDWFRIHDANVFKDPEAARVVLESNIPLLLTPVETSSAQLTLDAADLRVLGASGPSGAYLYRKSRVWLWFWTRFIKAKGAPPFDVLAIIPATRPDLLITEKRYAALDQSGNLIVRRRSMNHSRPVQWCSGVADNTKSFVLQRLSASDDRFWRQKP